jgi:hypothetical protein
VERRPRISVLLPLQDERSSALACVRAWVGQEADSEDYEVIALAPGEDSAMEATVRPVLRAHDRWIDRPGSDEYELFDIGAAAAVGTYLFLTEAHCIPDPDCIAAILGELERTDADGIRGESVPEIQGPLGTLELEMFEEAQAAEEDPEHWRKILIHSLALRRDTFLEAGGTPSRYGDFCTWVLAIELHRRGASIRYSPRPRVRHAYDGDLEHVDPFVRSFRQGEVLYRSEREPEDVKEYLEWVPEWERRLEYTRGGALRAIRAALALRHPSALRALSSHVLVAALGSWPARAQARARAAVARRRAVQAQDPDSGRRSFREFWRQTSRRGVLDGLAETRPGPPRIDPTPRLDLTESLSGRAIGLHDRESVNGGPPFRWTGPLALIRVNVPGERRLRARLELLPFERPKDARPRLAVDRQVVDAVVTDDAIEFEIDRGEHWISLACAPIRPRRFGVDDGRALGLPLRALRFEPSAG